MRPASLLPIVAALACAGAGAEPDPWYVGASQTFTYDSNVLRLRDNQSAGTRSKSDTISATALIAGLDQPIGRQRLYGNATLRALRYGNNDLYDGQSYALLGGVDWATIGRLSGRLEVAARRDPRPDLRDQDGAFIDEDNFESTRQVDFTARLGVVTRMSIEAALGWRDVGYSAERSRFREYTQDSASLGLRYRPAAATTFGIGVRRTQTDYPNLPLAPQLIGDRRTRNDLDLLASWEPSDVSRFDARVSFGRTTHDALPQRDFSSTGWAVAWDWRPGGRLKLLSRFARDAGQDAAAYTNPLSRTTDSLRMQADYALTSKISLDASALLYRRSLQTGSGVSGHDSGQVLGLGARWAVLRNVTLGCRIGHERRSDISNAVLYNDAFTARTFSCYGQALLQ